MPGFSDQILDVHAYLSQFTDWKFKKPLTPDDYRWSSVNLRLRVTTTSNNTGGEVNYRAPSNYNLLLFEIHGHLAFNAWTTETIAIAGVGNPLVYERYALKASNCRVAFSNTDREGGTRIFDTNDKPLSNLLPLTGGNPLKFNPPQIVRNGENLRMTLTMQDTGATIIGGSTDYGLDLTALLVRHSE